MRKPEVMLLQLNIFFSIATVLPFTSPKYGFRGSVLVAVWIQRVCVILLLMSVFNVSCCRAHSLD